MNALEPNDDPISALRRYLALWDRDDAPPDLSAFLKDHSDTSESERIEILLIDQRKRWTSGRPKVAEDYMREFPDLIVDDDRRVDLAYGEYLARREIGESIDIEKFLDRFASIKALLERQLLWEGWNQDLGESSERKDRAFAESMPTLINNYDPDAPLDLSDFDLLEPPFAAGGMGIIYKAWRKSLKTHVAVKILKKTDGRGAESVRRFINEARMVAKLRHPNILHVQGTGRTAEGRYFIVMDWVDGPDLEKRISVQKLNPKRAAELTAQVAEAVAYAHSKGVVHRDLKPSNVLLDGDRAVVTDFGLAKSLNGFDPIHEDSDKILGTLAYMAPEQVLRGWGPIDQRTDIFGLGALLYKLMTGKPPYQGVTIEELIDRVSSSDAIPAPSKVVGRGRRIPKKLEAICRKCLTKDPAGRYQSAEDVARALRDSTRRGFGEWIAAGLGVPLLLIASIFTVNKTILPSPPDPIVVRSFDVLRVRGNETTNLVKSAGSIKNDDKIRLDVLLSRPGFIYVWWIDSDGKAKLIQPVGSAMRNPKRTDHLRLPEQPGNGVIVTGTSGTEVVVLTARDEPFSESELGKLKGKISRSVPIPKISSDVVLLDENRIVSKVSDDELVAFGDEKPRGLGDEAPLFEPDVMKPIQDLRRELGEGFGDVHILALPHE